MAQIGPKTLRALEQGTSKTLSASSKIPTVSLMKSKTNSPLSQPLTTQAGRQAVAETSTMSKRQQQEQTITSRAGPIKQTPWDITSTLRIYPDHKDSFLLTQNGTHQIQVKDIWI